MTDPKTPDAIDDDVLDTISGGPTEELFGAYNFHVLASDPAKATRLSGPMRGFIGETEKN